MAVFKEALQLKQVPLLSSLDSKQLKLLAFTCEVFDYAAQDYLFHEGETSDCVYVILAGVVEIIGGDQDGQPVLLATSSENNLIGEMAVLSGASRAASVKAQGAVTALEDSERPVPRTGHREPRGRAARDADSQRKTGGYQPAYRRTTEPHRPAGKWMTPVAGRPTGPPGKKAK